MTPLMFSIRNPRFTFRNRANGLTLIEMLIGMAITLVMMAAVVTLFANVGQSVSTRRAGMEMNGQLRMVRSRLFKDLAGATCPAKPWREPGNDEGYIEIIEGRWSDKVPTDLDLDATSIIPGSQLSSGGPTDGMGLGDYDDILALTVRSESEPFVGRLVEWKDPDGGGPKPPQWVGTTEKSNVAEVIWYAVENPADGSLGEPGMRTVYRRVLLIAPFLPTVRRPLRRIPPYVDQTIDTDSGPVDVKGIGDDNICYQFCDVSFRREGDNRVPNTLSDLTKRENRFAHHLNGTTAFPHLIDLSAIRIVAPATNSPTNSPSPLHPFSSPFAPVSTLPNFPERDGEDVMLNDVLAFDLRVFDPGAPLYDVAGTIVEPSDAGWEQAYVAIELLNDIFDSMIGQGAYVDLGYVEAVGLASIPRNPPLPSSQPARPQFDGVPNLKSLLNFSALANPIKSVAYDTWSTHYESDGIDQDGFNGNDQGTNGLDDIDPTFADPFDQVTSKDQAVNGTDDVGERETSPPYDVPLRGMQVKIRIYERDTRQIREATVTKNFSD
jgi:type II secretory pathway pseudopilin PulG